MRTWCVFNDLDIKFGVNVKSFKFSRLNGAMRGREGGGQKEIVLTNLQKIAILGNRLGRLMGNPVLDVSKNDPMVFQQFNKNFVNSSISPASG